MRGLFAYAPPPAADELLGSWIHRIAIAHGVNGTSFLQAEAGDLDWGASDELLRWLSRGSGVPTSILRSMTISCRAPNANRAEFALASGARFPGCQAYCPRCGRQDRAEHGEAVQRQANAGRWRMACSQHGLLLDGVDDEDQLIPASRRPKHNWLDGRLPVDREFQAPAFVFAFERAVRAAESGRQPGGYWIAAAPGAFVEIAQLIASVALLRQRFGGFSESAAGALLAGRLAWRIGIDFFDPTAIDRAPTRSRVRALMAAALLMLSPLGVDRLGVADWPPLRAIVEWRRTASTPWEAAIAPWHWATLDLLLDFINDWPRRLRQPVEAMVLPRMKFVEV
jgi:hypothetical protein